MAHDVFISYSSKDKPIADGITANLEAAGLRCWIAPATSALAMTFQQRWPMRLLPAR